MTLNLAATNRLAWQERKAMPFSVTPFACGNANLGYRETSRYGGPLYKTGAERRDQIGNFTGDRDGDFGRCGQLEHGLPLIDVSVVPADLLQCAAGGVGRKPGDAGGRLPWWHHLASTPRRPYETTGPLFALHLRRGCYQRRNTEVRLTYRWREMDSNFQFRAR